MKNKYFLIGAALCGAMALGLTSCDNDKFLTVDLYDGVDPAGSYEKDANVEKVLLGVYDMMYPDDKYDGDWGFKPNLFTGCHPTIDTQATGWDKNWNSQAWNATSSELLAGWKHVYAGINRANDFLGGLETAPDVPTLTHAVRKRTEGEARALRGFYYHWLATTFGRVPMLASGENYNNTPTKPRAETYEEMWNFIIEDFEKAAELLEWTPYNNEYGRATKGMALAYLGDAYMWKAYRLTDGANGQKQDEAEAKKLYAKAADCFRQILESHTYSLNESFTTLWDPASAWGPETVWCEQLDEGTNWGQWGNLTSKLMLKWYTACPENGGWGSLYLSWEWYSSYEKGDKRRAGSCYTGAVPQIDPNNPLYDEAKYKDWYEPAIYGVNPYLQEVLGKGEAGTTTKQFHFNNGEWAPAIWSSKLWRTASANYQSWGDGHWSPTPIYWKRLPNIMLDYAECLFRVNGENDETAWGLIDELRQRAFGILEKGKEAALTTKYMAYYNDYSNWIGTTGQNPRVEGDNVDGGSFYKKRANYPIPFGTELTAEQVTKAKEYYTALKAKKHFDSPVWKVAVNEERRKEFNCEWSLRPDMQRSGYMADHVAHNYPKREIADKDMKDTPWTIRTYNYDDRKMDMPIPQEELTKNPACDQNPGYDDKQ